MERKELSMMTLRYFTSLYIDMKEDVFTHVVLLEAWSPVEKGQGLASKELKISPQDMLNTHLIVL